MRKSMHVQSTDINRIRSVYGMSYVSAKKIVPVRAIEEVLHIHSLLCGR